ncbi:MAG: hypothetical protein ACKVP4_10505 [Hyphomicrobium sp.]
MTLRKRHVLSLLVLIFTLIGISVVQAWTGPTAAPPGNNVAAPINVGVVDQVKNGGLSLNTLVIFGNTLFSGLGAGIGRYLNFDYTTGGTSGTGASGYGFRDNSGIMEVKNRGGAWAPFATTTSAGAFQQIRFTDGTTQTTAGGGISAVTTLSCSPAVGGSCTTPNCPAGYFRVGCSHLQTQSGGTEGTGAAPSGAAACLCRGSGLNTGTCYAYCAK